VPGWRRWALLGWRRGGWGGWWKGGRLELATASTPAFPPLLAERQIVVLNAIDRRRRTFASKSVQHSLMPGTTPLPSDAARASGEGSIAESDESSLSGRMASLWRGVSRGEPKRGINTFALRVSPSPSEPEGTAATNATGTLASEAPASAGDADASSGDEGPYVTLELLNFVDLRFGDASVSNWLGRYFFKGLIDRLEARLRLGS
jgi:hypothetical protein